MHYLIKIAIDEYDEVASLLSYFGLNNGNSSSNYEVQEYSINFPSNNETFQMPVRVGKSGEEEETPWIVSKHAPGKENATATHPNGHNGLDLKAPRGTPVYPIASGVVVKVGQDPKGGNVVFTMHAEGKIRVYYAHLDSISVQDGQPVSKNTQIGTVGDSGNAKGRGTHLHFEVRVDGRQTDPVSLVGKSLTAFAKTNFNKEKIINSIEMRKTILLDISK
jgi:murein DD-endopeptidase MepM/ murein hydrolase activator NlpD